MSLVDDHMTVRVVLTRESTVSGYNNECIRAMNIV